MSIYLNVFPVVKYPEEIEVVSLEYSDENYEKYKNFCYRIGDKLYIYGNGLNGSKKISLVQGNREFSLLLRHLILEAIKETYNKEKYRIEDKRKRLTIIRKEPSIRTDYVEVFEGIEIQTIHWQDLNFGLIVDYLTRNSFTEKFKTEKLSENASLPAPSYSNFYKYLGYKEAKDIMTKIGNLRGEKVKGRMRSDALEQRMTKIKEFLMDCLDWEEGPQKKLSLPTGEGIVVSNKNVKVILLSGKGGP